MDESQPMDELAHRKEFPELYDVMKDVFEDMLATTPSNLIEVNTLVAIRQQVHLLNAAGVFDDDETPIGKLFHVPGEDCNYVSIVRCLDENIEQLQKDDSDLLAQLQPNPSYQMYYINDENREEFQKLGNRMITELADGMVATGNAFVEARSQNRLGAVDPDLLNVMQQWIRNIDEVERDVISNCRKAANALLDKSAPLGAESIIADANVKMLLKEQQDYVNGASKKRRLGASFARPLDSARISDTDWRLLFPASTGVTAAERAAEEAAEKEEQIQKVHKQRQSRLETLKKRLNDPNGAAADLFLTLTASDQRGAFVAQLHTYWLHWVNGNRVHATLTILPYGLLVGGLLGLAVPAGATSGMFCATSFVKVLWDASGQGTEEGLGKMLEALTNYTKDALRRPSLLSLPRMMRMGGQAVISVGKLTGLYKTNYWELLTLVGSLTGDCSIAPKDMEAKGATCHAAAPWNRPINWDMVWGEDLAALKNSRATVKKVDEVMGLVANSADVESITHALSSAKYGRTFLAQGRKGAIAHGLATAAQKTFGHTQLHKFLNVFWESGKQVFTLVDRASSAMAFILQVHNFYTCEYRPDQVHLFLYNNDPNEQANKTLLKDQRDTLNGLRRIYINQRGSGLATWVGQLANVPQPTIQQWLTSETQMFTAAERKWKALFNNHLTVGWNDIRPQELLEKAMALKPKIEEIKDRKQILEGYPVADANHDPNGLNTTDAVKAQLGILSKYWHDNTVGIPAGIPDLRIAEASDDWYKNWREMHKYYRKLSAAKRTPMWGVVQEDLIEAGNGVSENWYMLYKVLSYHCAYLRGDQVEYEIDNITRPNNRAICVIGDQHMNPPQPAPAPLPMPGLDTIVTDMKAIYELARGMLLGAGKFEFQNPNPLGTDSAQSITDMYDKYYPNDRWSNQFLAQPPPPPAGGGGGGGGGRGGRRGRGRGRGRGGAAQAGGGAAQGGGPAQGGGGLGAMPPLGPQPVGPAQNPVMPGNVLPQGGAAPPLQPVGAAPNNGGGAVGMAAVSVVEEVFSRLHLLRLS